MRARTLIIVFALAGLAAGCESLQPASKPEVVRKGPQLTEGQLQEQFILKRGEGKRLLEAKQYGKALDAFLEANEIRPTAVETVLGIGQAYVGLEYYEKAKRYFDRYLDLEKDRDPAIYIMIAEVYGNDLEYWDSAAKLLTKVIELRGSSAGGLDYWNRGNMLQKGGKKDEAVADFSRALELAQRDKDLKLIQQCKDSIVKVRG